MSKPSRGKSKLPVATVKRLFKEALGDADVRLSDDAIQTLVKYLEDLIAKIAPVAYDIARNAKRKTIRREDVETALKALKRERRLF